MNDLINEIIYAPRQVNNSRHSSTCNCRSCEANRETKEEEFFWWNNFPDFWSTNRPISQGRLSSAQISSAIAYNKKYASSKGWLPFKKEISRKLLNLGSSPTDNQFVQAVADWQAKNGFSGKNVDGKIGSGTWRKMQQSLGLNLVRFRGPLRDVAIPMPTGSTHYLRMTGTERYFGIPETISALRWIAGEWNKRHKNIRMNIHDISQKGGGKISGHNSHRLGLDADVYLSLIVNGVKRRIGNSARDGERGTKIVKNYPAYRKYAKEFIEIVLRNPHLKVKDIWFFDDSISWKIRPSGTSKDHFRHFHIRFCMPDWYKRKRPIAKAYKSYEKKGNYSCR